MPKPDPEPGLPEPDPGLPEPDPGLPEPVPGAPESPPERGRVSNIALIPLSGCGKEPAVPAPAPVPEPASELVPVPALPNPAPVNPNPPADPLIFPLELVELTVIVLMPPIEEDEELELDETDTVFPLPKVMVFVASVPLTITTTIF